MASNNKATLPPFPEVNPELLQEWNYEKNKGIDPHSLSAGSPKKVWWLCNTCQHEWEAILCNRARKGRGCPKCAKVYVDKDDSIAILFPSLMKEWHPSLNKHLDPTKISRGSAKRVQWICAEGHIWESSVINRTKNDAGCTICSGYSPSEKNSLASLYPEVAEEWHPSKNGALTPADVTCKSGKKIWWKCKICLHEWQTTVKNRTHLGSPCPICSKDNAVIKAKQNKQDELDDLLPSYSYDSEDRLFLKYQEIQTIFKQFLKIESESKSIESLFSPRTFHRINYSPYYQRNYVWDKTKASYFIESVLIGTEIPPLIFFESPEGYEVIDGRQRFETLKRFHDNDLSLAPKGLYSLESQARKTFSTLDESLRDLFFDTKIRIINFTVVDASRFDKRSQDMLKKEIFRRYNSGITALRRLDVERAVYIYDEPTNYFKKHFTRNQSLYETIVRLFLPESDLAKLATKDTMEKAAQEVRFLLIAPEMSIMSTRVKNTVDQFYTHYAENITDVQKIYRDFLAILRIVISIEDHFVANNVIPNRYWYQALHWGIAILVREGVDVDVLKEEFWKEKFLNFYRNQLSLFVTDQSQFLYQQFFLRYSGLSQFLSAEFNINLSIYVRSNTRRNNILTAPEDEASLSSETDAFLHIDKQEPVLYSIDDICRLMLRSRFIVRPVYQRGEVINRSKSSAIIESIILGVKLPPLYIFKRENGQWEVVDGQQRLLSILGYISQPFSDETGQQVHSQKDGYSLTNLRILEELNGKKYDELNQDMKDTILDFPLSLILIEEKFNKLFDPVDLFIRLNSRPYPIKENTFEMWNSYVDKEIIDDLRALTDRYQSWFYLTKTNKNVRMRNEELITILAYLEYRHSTSKKIKAEASEFVDVFRRESNIGVRIKQKSDVTNLLNQATVDSTVKDGFRKSIRLTDSLIRKLRTILIDKEVDNETEFLEAELTSLFNVDKKRNYARRFQDYYAIWYLTNSFNQEMVNINRLSIKKGLQNLLSFMKSAEKETDVSTVIDEFNSIVAEFKNKYSIDERKIKLTDDEKAAIIKRQGGTCPICCGPLFTNDEVEVDHMMPIAKGGKDRFLNLQVAHKYCNRKKGKM